MTKLQNLNEFIQLVQQPAGDLTVIDWRLVRFFLKDPKNSRTVLDAVDAGLEAPAAHVQKFAKFDAFEYAAYRRYKNDAVFTDDNHFTSTRFLLATLNRRWSDDSWQTGEGFELVHAQVLRMLAAARISPDLGYLYGYRQHANDVTHVQGLALLNVFYPQHLFLSDMRPNDISPAKMAEVDTAAHVMEGAALKTWLQGLLSDSELTQASGLAPHFLRELYPQVALNGYRAYYAQVNGPQ